ncbi:alpha/beta hydrolase [Peterkaempfera griseoplana]|uniref:alpha/beta hydrolase n=1 Tax=Peterkaempfera griseoplana TaxID=66896 RepID=UPI0006E302E1|nr:alpha/beta hydrolase [Peterkaempfera griseoplana]
MTAFVLVPGGFTGDWVWEEVAGRLRAAGAGAYPAALTGMGGADRPAGPGTDLRTHIDDLVRLIDRVDDPEVVLVGHDYGIHPVLGAADLRPGRIIRIVYLDTAIPQDGAPALAQIPDQGLRDRLLDPEQPDGDDWRVPAPSADGWPAWGSTAGLSTDALDRLSRLAAPQPRATLTQPLRLTGAASGVPTTGVLCTANGSTIALVETMIGFGDPALQALTRPGVTFFELDTGHWPMLSAPDELTRVLLAAAAGEGHRMGARTAEQPRHLTSFLMDLPERPRVRSGRVDLHLPEAGHPCPAVLFVHGGPIPADSRPTPRDWPSLVGHARCAAGLGAVGAVVDHRLHDLGDYGRAAEDVAEAVALLRDDPHVDGERIALWFFSGGGLLAADWLAAPPPWLRCVAASYPVLAPLPNWGSMDPRFRPAAAVGTAGGLPVVLTRVGLEQPAIAATVAEFLAAAEDRKADVEVIDVPNGHHGFDTADPTEESRRAVDRAMRSVLGHLRD